METITENDTSEASETDILQCQTPISTPDETPNDTFTIDVVEVDTPERTIERKTDPLNTIIISSEPLALSPLPTHSPNIRFLRSNSFDNLYQTHCQKTQRKQELNHIHKMLSISRIPSNPTPEPSSPHPGEAYQHLYTTPSKRATVQNMDLCAEFCWCCWCCIDSAALCAPLLQLRCNRSSDKTQTPIYDCLFNILYSPIYKNETYELTGIQKLIISIRFCFEIYKTMIGSYLTIFTPQKCNNGICTLYENLVPKDNMEIVALCINSVMAASLLFEYTIELMREKILRMYFENDPRLPVEKEYFTNLLGILDTKRATMFSEQSALISVIFRLYRRIAIILLSIYVVNICISAIVIYKNYYDKSSLFGFTTNALFIVFKMANILKIAIHSIKIPYSAYIDSPVAFNSLRPQYIRPEIKNHFLRPTDGPTNENIQYFIENRQYMRFLLDNFNIELAEFTPNDYSASYEELPTATLRTRHSFS
jgi:hypothetical protein